jgi:hypothetical protein
LPGAFAWLDALEAVAEGGLNSPPDKAGGVEADALVKPICHNV